MVYGDAQQRQDLVQTGHIRFSGKILRQGSTCLGQEQKAQRQGGTTIAML
jgi:hypothetical protein